MLYFLHDVRAEILTNQTHRHQQEGVLLACPVKQLTSLSDEDNDHLETVEFKASLDTLRGYREGTFAHITAGSNNVITNIRDGNSDVVAKGEFVRNNYYRGKLLPKYSTTSLVRSKDILADIHSYHVNVGHGNCSFIAFRRNNKPEIWGIDCSRWDITQHLDCWHNIQLCINHIATKYHASFVLNKFFLTHPHYDHYSGMFNLLKNQYLTSATEVWINFHYSWPQSKYSNLLRMLGKLSCLFIEPKTTNSTDNITIWHPTRTVVRSMTPKYTAANAMTVSKVNNSSAVFEFTFGNKRIVFPGDIETEGWDSIDACDCANRPTTYYCISHHGSITGHTRNGCHQNPSLNSLNTVTPCFRASSRRLLMGRDQAYRGIFSAQVLNDFSQNLHRSDKPMMYFYELNWATDAIKCF